MNSQPDEHILNIRKAISFIESKGENPTELDYSSALLISPYYIKYMPRDKITLNIYELAVSLDIDLSNSIPEFQDKMEKKINKVFNVITKMDFYNGTSNYRQSYKRLCIYSKMQ